jgi:hypothetical protein
MAKIIRREWTMRGPTGKRVRHVAYGYTLMANGRRERKVSSAWLTEADVIEALAQRQKEIAAGIVGPRVERTLGELAEEYLAYKRDHGKRTLSEDERITKRQLLPALGAALPVRRLTVAAIAQYERARASHVSAYTV